MKRLRKRLKTVSEQQNRRGAMLIFIAVLLLVFVGIIAFSVDVAYMHLSRTQLRTASDAAARAAGARCVPTAPGSRRRTFPT